MTVMEQAHAPTADDAALLRRYAGSGDPAAFAELVQRYAGMVYATARRVTGDPSSAEDVSQDCFLRLARASSVIEGSLPGWLHRTSVNRSLELVRSDRARRRRETDRAALMRAEAGAQNPEAIEDSSQLIAQVDQAMGQLPDELRAILTEHFLCGQTQQAIALRLSVDQSTVSRRIDSALHALRRQLRGAGFATATLPMVLAGLASAGESSLTPASLSLSLTKIGLSGVRGSASSSSATASMSATTVVTSA
ncbi:MAG: sigma-70 family RNA polymerase sigma factor, partial [Verrucomicrobiota bacterium]|nr:sigma-70 family RNA polymerase sigma factor [Verrucomicrobiota bacterium]